VLYTLTKYEKLIQEHEVIQANTRLIASSADNLYTLSNLQDTTADFTYHQMNFLSDKRVNLKRAITSLRDGLIDHQNREEEIMESIVGAPLMQVIKREHREILSKLSEIDWIMLNIGPVGILVNSEFLKQKVDELCAALSSNCLRENSVLELLIKLPEN
jgi:hemerythrin